MRFRAELIDYQLFQQLLQSLQRLGQHCVVSLNRESVRFFLTAEFSSGEQGFAEVNVDSLFEKYRIESKSDDEIPFIVDIGDLYRALISAADATRTVVKLTKKNETAYLTWELTNETRKLVQDVPIVIQHVRKLQDCQEPDLPPPKVKIRMPPLASLKTVIDRMKGVSDEVHLVASSTGQVNFEVHTEMVTIRTFYRNLALNAAAAASQRATSRASLAIKKLANVLHCQVLDASVLICCIVENQALVVYAKLERGAGTVTYYIPLLAPDDEDDDAADDDAADDLEMETQQPAARAR